MSHGELLARILNALRDIYGLLDERLPPKVATKPSERETLDAEKQAGESVASERAIVVGSEWQRGAIRVVVLSAVGGVQFKRVETPDGLGDYEDATTREFRLTYTWLYDPPTASEPVSETKGEA